MPSKSRKDKKKKKKISGQSDSEDDLVHYPVSPKFDSEMNKSFASAFVESPESSDGWEEEVIDSDDGVFENKHEEVTIESIEAPDLFHDELLSDEEPESDLLNTSSTKKNEIGSKPAPALRNIATENLSGQSDQDDDDDEDEESDAESYIGTDEDSDAESFKDAAPYLKEAGASRNLDVEDSNRGASPPLTPNAKQFSPNENSPTRNKKGISPFGVDRSPMAQTWRADDIQADSHTPKPGEANVEPNQYIGYRHIDSSRPSEPRIVSPGIYGPDPNENPEEYFKQHTENSNVHSSAPTGHDYFSDVNVNCNEDDDDPAHSPSGDAGGDGRNYMSSDPDTDPYYDSSDPDPRNQAMESPRSFKPAVYKAEYPDADSALEEGRSIRRHDQDSVAITEYYRQDRRLILWLFLCLCCALVSLSALAGGIVGATVLHDALKKDKTSSSQDEDSPETAAPAPATAPTPETAPTPADGVPIKAPAVTPTAAPVAAGPKFEIRNQALFDLVAAASSDEGASIRVVGSPQNLAYTWLEDDSKEQSLSESRKLQRYALACFYHSTDGKDWTNDGGWLTAMDECLWHNDAVDTFTCTGETLNVLQFSQNNIGGVLPPELGLLSGLTRLAILNDPDGTGMAGGFPVELQALTLMKEIELEGNSFSEPIPPELFQSWNLLDVMLLNGNGIPGPIPTTIGNLAATRINLGNNQFSGPIPDEIGGLSNVVQFTLSENQLTGPIPTTIGLLTSAKGVYLNGNGLSGDVPPELGNLESIKGGLDISNNKLSGTIPSAIASRPDLKSFLVQNNEMTGPIPDFSALINLREFRIDGNKFTGRVPDGTCTAILNKGAEAYADCPDEIECPCCTFCCNSDGVCSAPP